MAAAGAFALAVVAVAAAAVVAAAGAFALAAVDAAAEVAASVAASALVPAGAGPPGAGLEWSSRFSTKTTLLSLSCLRLCAFTHTCHPAGQQGVYITECARVEAWAHQRWY